MLIMMIMIHRNEGVDDVDDADGVYGDVAQDVGDHLGGDRTQRADNAEEEYNRLDGDCRPYRSCLSDLAQDYSHFLVDDQRWRVGEESIGGYS